MNAYHHLTEINNETLRCKAADATLDAALDDVLKRMSLMEMGQMKLQSQLNEANELRAKDVATIIQLKVDLESTRQSVAELTTAAARRDSMLNTMKLDVAESSRNADFAMSKARVLEEHVQRWLSEELRKKREAQEVARKQREEEERQRRAVEAARLEEERKRRVAEAEEQRRQAEAKAAKEEEDARMREQERLREEARKAHEEERRRAQERDRREAEAERQRREAEKADKARREFEKEEFLRKIREIAVLSRWDVYQKPHVEGELTFDNIVWPVVEQPADLSGLTQGAIDYFLFSKVHSPKRKRRPRFNEALLRWHPDKYALIESRVRPCDRPVVEQAFNDITVHLNNLRTMYALMSDDDN